MDPLLLTSFHSPEPPGVLPDLSHPTASFGDIGGVGWGCGAEFLPRYTLDRQWCRRFFSITIIVRSRYVMCRGCPYSVYGSLMPAFLNTVETSPTCPYLAKNAPKWFSLIYMGTPCTVILVLRVSMYSVCILTD